MQEKFTDPKFKTKAMNKAEITTPEQFLVDFMILLGDDELTWEAAQDHALKLLKDWREQYASEERKEAAVEFELRDAIKPIHKAIRGMTEKRYDNWLKQKEGKQ